MILCLPGPGLSRVLAAGCLLLPAVSVAGCGRGTGELSGQVSYRGRTLASGSVLLIARDGHARTAAIQVDGGYRFADVPVGQARLAVHSPDPSKRPELRKMPGGRQDGQAGPHEPPPADRGKWFAIPASYGDVERSGLRVAIDRGPNLFNIDMK